MAENLSRLDSQTIPVTIGADLPLTVSVTFSQSDLDEGDKNFIVDLGVLRSGGSSPSFTVTLNGQSMTQSGTQTSSGGGNNLSSNMYYLKDANLPTTAGTYDLVITKAGGGTIVFVAGEWHLINHSEQVANPTYVSNSESSATAISVSNGIPSRAIFIGSASSLSIAAGGWDVNNDFTKLFSPTENPGGSATFGFRQPTTGSVGTAVTFTKNNATGDKMVAQSIVILNKPNTDIQFQCALSASSALLSRLNTNIIASTSVATSVVTAFSLQRDRGYVATVAPVATITPILETNRNLQTLIAAASTVTVQPFDRATELAALVTPVATPSGKFDATRPLATVISEQLTVEAAFGNNFQETQYSPTPGDYVELFEIDTTVIGGTDVFRFVPHRFEAPDAQVQWKGNTFILFPVEADGFEQTATGAAPAQPTMRVANVNKFILAAVLELGDIVGAKVTRWRTYARFLDNGETPDSNAHYAPDIYYIQQKTGHTREGFEFTLSSVLDLPGIKLPRRQILKDQSSDDRNLYAPGAANVRFRGR